MKHLTFTLWNSCKWNSKYQTVTPWNGRTAPLRGCNRRMFGIFCPPTRHMGSGAWTGNPGLGCGRGQGPMCPACLRRLAFEPCRGRRAAWSTSVSDSLARLQKMHTQMFSLTPSHTLIWILRARTHTHTQSWAHKPSGSWTGLKGYYFGPNYYLTSFSPADPAPPLLLRGTSPPNATPRRPPSWTWGHQPETRSLWPHATQGCSEVISHGLAHIEHHWAVGGRLSDDL